MSLLLLPRKNGFKILPRWLSKLNPFYEINAFVWSVSGSEHGPST